MNSGALSLALILGLAQPAVFAASKKEECAVAVMAARQEATDSLDEYGNLKNPNDILLQKEKGLIKKIFSKKIELPKVIQKAPIGTPHALAYFIQDFRPELNNLIQTRAIDLSLLTELKTRLFQMEDYRTKKQFYLLRMDDLSKEMTEMKKEDLQKIFIFSHEPDNLKIHSHYNSRNYQGRVTPLSDFSFSASMEEMEKLKEETVSPWPNYREVYTLSTGDALEVTGVYTSGWVHGSNVEHRIFKNTAKIPLDVQDVMKMVSPGHLEFVRSFQSEFTTMLRNKQLTLNQLLDLDRRLLQAENPETKQKYYILRLDDLKKSFASLDGYDTYVFAMKDSVQPGQQGQISVLKDLQRADLGFASKPKAGTSYKDVLHVENGFSIQLSGTYSQYESYHRAEVKIMKTVLGEPKNVDDVLRILKEEE